MRNQKGQALVETALIIPLLLLLVMGLFEFGRVMYIKNTLNNAARAGVRVAVVTPKFIDANIDSNWLACPQVTPQSLAGVAILHWPKQSSFSIDLRQYL